MIGVKNLDHKRIRRLIYLVFTLFVLLGYSLHSAVGTAYYSMLMQANGAVSSPPVILESGTAGTSIIYTNSTSARISTAALAPTPIYYPNNYGNGGNWYSGNWYDPGWSYRKRITINYAQVQANLTAFPVLINLTSDSGLASHTQGNGNDILFTSFDGITKLSHEIEKYVSTTGALVAWVKVPSLSSSVDTNLYMYYGSPSCGSQQNATNVWDSYFKGVWHLKEDPSSTAPQMKDSTKANNGTSGGTMTSGDQLACKIDGGLDFDGSDDNINCGDIDTVDGATALTVSAWVKCLDLTRDGMVLAKDTFAANSELSFWRDETTSTGGRTDTLSAEVGTGSADARYYGSTGLINNNNWHFVVMTYVGGSATGLRGYVDGVEDTAQSPVSTTSVPALRSTTYSVYIGRSQGGSPYFTGDIDEVRISSIARTAAWISTEYHNQNSPNTFYSLDAQEENHRVSGTVPTSLQTVDSDYFVVQSTESATSMMAYNPSGYNLIGSTTFVSGAINDVASDNGVYMTFRSYVSQSSSSTFGYSTAGGSYITVSANYMYGSVFTSPAYSGMTVQNITFRGRRDGFSGTANVKCVLVRHSDLTIIATGNPVLTSTALNWYTSTFSSPPSISASTEYIIMLIPDASERFYYGSGSTNQGHYDSTNNYTIPTNPTDAAHNNDQYSIYCTFTYPSQYTCEVEFTGTSNTLSLAQLVWTIDSSFTTDSVAATFQLYNYQTGSYPTSGDGYMSDTIGATDVTKTQTIIANPAYYRDVSGNWKIKVKGVKTTNSQFDFRADWTEFKTSYYSEYTVSMEFLFSGISMINAPSQLNFTVVSEYNITSVNATIQIWNYSSSAYVTSGEGYLAYTSTGANITKNLSIVTSPQLYVSDGYARIKVTGAKATTTQYRQRVNQVKLAYCYGASSNYNYVLRMNETQGANWKIRLSAYGQSNIGRLTNCSIYIYDGSNSSQIVISSGGYSQQTGPWYDLTASDTEYIWMHVEASSTDTSYIYVYLEILVPNITTHAQYILTFVIT